LKIFTNYLTYKAAEVGREIVKIDPKFTSQFRSQRHKFTLNKLTLEKRIFKCSFCSYQQNRDLNAAINILKN